MTDGPENSRVKPYSTSMPRRIGRFSISFEYLDPVDDGIRFSLRDVVVLDARANFARRVIEYIAVCDEFDLVEFWSEVPFYDCEIKHLHDEVGQMFSVAWRRRQV